MSSTFGCASKEAMLTFLRAKRDGGELPTEQAIELATIEAEMADPRAEGVLSRQHFMRLRQLFQAHGGPIKRGRAQVTRSAAPSHGTIVRAYERRGAAAYDALVEQARAALSMRPLLPSERHRRM